MAALTAGSGWGWGAAWPGFPAPVLAALPSLCSVSLGYQARIL